MATLRTWKPFGELGAMSARMLSSPRACVAQSQFCATAFCCRFWCFVQGGDVCWLQCLLLFAADPQVNSAVRLGIVKPHSAPSGPGFCFPTLVWFCLSHVSNDHCLRAPNRRALCIPGSRKIGTVQIRGGVQAQRWFQVVT